MRIVSVFTNEAGMAGHITFRLSGKNPRTGEYTYPILPACDFSYTKYAAKRITRISEIKNAAWLIFLFSIHALINKYAGMAKATTKKRYLIIPHINRLNMMIVDITKKFF